MNNLVVFDIDGTLIHLCDKEDQAYVTAIEQAMGPIPELNMRWHEYRYSTDSGVFSEIIQTALHRPPTALEHKAVEANFAEQLKQTEYRPIAGAQHIFDAILAIGWDVAIATGAWKSAAESKLGSAKLFRDTIPLATSNDHYERKDIIQCAVERSKEHYKRTDYRTIIYVGDRPWDLKATQQLGIPFIGIGEHWQQIANGAFYHTPHYTPSTFTAYLETL
ncbi:MAG: HAD family hydrolase [Verrucomicrobia bacterium]|nr:HAD family hydrolase [Verrucomicrobiota bacterium]